MKTRLLLPLAAMLLFATSAARADMFGTAVGAVSVPLPAPSSATPWAGATAPSSAAVSVVLSVPLSGSRCRKVRRTPPPGLLPGSPGSLCSGPHVEYRYYGHRPGYAWGHAKHERRHQHDHHHGYHH